MGENRMIVYINAGGGRDRRKKAMFHGGEVWQSRVVIMKTISGSS